ncbi:hypothetical protein SY88_18975 [Clostridiales bacterium PH28_bin88]|nr:hypothetical protein SY88_18975 [Clostridiales bacterium PH28_bin88]
MALDQPRAKRVNDNGWTVAEDQNGKSTTETWPAGKLEPGASLQVLDTGQLFWRTLPGPPPPAEQPEVAWLEAAARAWLERYGPGNERT